MSFLKGVSPARSSYRFQFTPSVSVACPRMSFEAKISISIYSVQNIDKTWYKNVTTVNETEFFHCKILIQRFQAQTEQNYYMHNNIGKPRSRCPILYAVPQILKVESVESILLISSYLLTYCDAELKCKSMPTYRAEHRRYFILIGMSVKTTFCTQLVSFAFHLQVILKIIPSFACGHELYCDRRSIFRGKDHKSWHLSIVLFSQFYMKFAEILI